MNIRSTLRGLNLNRISNVINWPHQCTKTIQHFFHKTTGTASKGGAEGFEVNKHIPEASKSKTLNNATVDPAKLNPQPQASSTQKSQSPPSASKTNDIKQNNDIPILLPFSGETLNEVKEGLRAACKIENDTKIFNHLHEAFKNTISGHKYRGYGLLNQNGIEEPLIQVGKISNFTGLEPGSQRPLYFIFPGVGSQWNEMGTDLMRIDAFQESMKRSHVSLKTVGMDLQKLLKPGNADLIGNIRDASVAVTAIQIALYDTLLSLGLQPDGFIGYSSGEILCAYADGCLSAEETLLVSNARAKALYDTRYSPGAMADVGLAWEDSNSKIPSGIHQACHNTSTNMTIAGPLQAVQTFVSQLQSKGIHAQRVNSCGFAIHSKCIESAKYLMFNYLHETYAGDRVRSKKWLSSSIPECEWRSPIAHTANPSYFVNNTMKPVLFHEALQHVPQNAVVLEIAPHGNILNFIKEGTQNKNIMSASLMDSKVEDKLSMFVSTLGSLYNAGIEMNFSNLYPSIKIATTTTTVGAPASIETDFNENPIISKKEMQLNIDRIQQ